MTMDENEIEPKHENEVARKPWKSSVYPDPRSSRVTESFSWAAAALPLVFVLGIGFGWFIWGRPAEQAPAATQGDTQVQLTRYQVPVDDDPSLGPADAPITIIEFSDYQCPFCIRWYKTVSSRLLSDYQGKIHFVYRDLPLTALHPDAQGAAEAADCAGAQGAYWPYHDALFGGNYGLGVQAYDRYASDLKLDMTDFDTCVAEHRYKSEVDADASFAIGQGLNATPVFFINGLKVVGAQPYEVFQQIIDEELTASGSK